jgi:hypothetical protein
LACALSVANQTNICEITFGGRDKERKTEQGVGKRIIRYSSAGQELEETSQVDWLAEAVFMAAQVLPLQ